MIEVEYELIALAAVDAGMRSQVLEDEYLVVDAIAGHTRHLAPDVDLTIADVVLSPVRRVADTAMALALASLDVAEREICFGLVEPAHAASGHDGTSLDPCRAPSSELPVARIALEHLFYHTQGAV